MIEPAAHGLVTLFGPNHRNYREALDLITMKAGSVFSSAKELLAAIKEQLQSCDTKEAQRNEIREYVKKSAERQDDVTKLLLRAFRAEPPNS